MSDELKKDEELLQPVENASQPEQNVSQPEQEATEQEVVQETEEVTAPLEEEATKEESKEEAHEEPPKEEVKEEEVPATEKDAKEEVVEEKKEPEEKPEEEEEAPEEPEVVKEEVDIEAIKAELEELKAEKQEQADVEALNKESTKVAGEFNQLCDEIGKALETRFKELDIPLDKTLDALEAEDKAKAKIAKDLIKEANDLIERAKHDATAYVANKTRDLIFKKADRLLRKYDVTEEEAEVVADTFLDIMDQAGIKDLGEDLAAKVELAVARAKMVCRKVEKVAEKAADVAEAVADKAAEVHDKIEKVEGIIKPKEEQGKEEKPSAEVAKEEIATKPDTSEFEEGVGNKPQPTSGLSIDNVVEKMLELPFKEQTKFYKEHYSLIEEAMKRRAR